MSLRERIVRLLRARIGALFSYQDQDTTLDHLPADGPRPRREPSRPLRPERAPEPDRIAELCRVLEVSPGTDLEMIKASYRRLMLAHHPDLRDSDESRRAATEMAQRLTQAYQELLRLLHAA